MVAVTNFFTLPKVVYLTTTTSSKTGKKSEAAEKYEKPEIVTEVGSQTTSPASSELTHPAQPPTTKRRVGVNIVSVKNQQMSLIDGQMSPVAKVPPKTIHRGTPADETIRDTISLRDKIEQPVDLEDIPKPEIPLWRANAVMLSDIPTAPRSPWLLMTPE